MTEDDIDPEPDKLEEMKQAIAGKKIMIIGGHANWQRRLKQMFPKWRFVATSDYLGKETVDGMDYIYFFTDFMSNALYNKFIRILRERDELLLHTWDEYRAEREADIWECGEGDVVAACFMV